MRRCSLGFSRWAEQEEVLPRRAHRCADESAHVLAHVLAGLHERRHGSVGGAVQPVRWVRSVRTLRHGARRCVQFQAELLPGVRRELQGGLPVLIRPGLRERRDGSMGGAVQPVRRVRSVRALRHGARRGVRVQAELLLGVRRKL